MPYKNQRSIVIPWETKHLLRSIKKEEESWDELLTRLANKEKKEIELLKPKEDYQQPTIL